SEYLNKFAKNSENNLWKGSFKENSFFLEKKYYDEIIIKKLSLDFLDTKYVEELSQLGDKLKVFRKSCYIINSTNEKINIYSPIEFLKRIIEEGKKSISIQRFKGLGEMNPEELWETTLNPENNTLLKVDYSGNDIDTETTNPGDKDREIFKILMGEDVVPRKDFINKNAINVNNLDI
ncbi:MAG: DNA topoisomerase IV subunit B, partial [Candidatus Fonsibacter sp.]|nr:DNA topoisomerase IV subunit B [Candidatus Fonsibacter sp.]